MSDSLYNLTLDIRERARYLQEIGVDSVSVELPELKEKEMAAFDHRSAIEKPSHPIEIPVLVTVPQPAKERRPAGSRLAELPSLSQRPVPVRPGDAEPQRPMTDIPQATPGQQPNVISAAAESIEAIRAEIGNCVRCPLHQGRTQIVHSTGNFAARLMFVGEAPGADEDSAGLPFVGRAGKLLTDIIAAMGFRREDVFIGNINRCRPPGNRQPLPIETEACRPFLLREVEAIKPKVIVVLGNTATQNLLGIKTPISKIRGQFQDYFGVKVMPTFHPAYLLRDPHKKREVWEDMKKVRDHINATVE
ncbi:hypothetical protein BH20ACI2_BH20ACI2_28330 [soil metagenome]